MAPPARESVSVSGIDGTAVFVVFPSYPSSEKSLAIPMPWVELGSLTSAL